MRVIGLLTLLLLPLPHLAAQGVARAGVPRPAACIALDPDPMSTPAEHVPYPPLRKRWPIDLSTATIVKDPSLRHYVSGAFRPVTVEQVRARLAGYFVVPRAHWENGYSHVGGGDESGWLVAGGRCFLWTVRPAGLAWIIYPDGNTVYLAEEITEWRP